MKTAYLACILQGALLLLTTPVQGDTLQAIRPGDHGTSAAVVVPDSLALVHTTQLLPLDEQGHLVSRSPAGQVQALLRRLDVLLREQRSSLERVVRLHVVLRTPEVGAELEKALARTWTGSLKPALTTVVGALPHPEAQLALDAVAALTQPGGVGLKVTPTAAILPPGTRLFVSGQAEKGQDLAEATRKTLESLRDTLKFLGRKESDIVQLRAFLQPLADVEKARQEVAKFFGKGPVPPVVWVEWRSTLPIEIELVAWGGRERAGEPVEYLTPPGMTPSKVYARVARVNDGPLIYLGGLHGPKSATPEKEIVAIFGDLQKVLGAAGSELKHLVRATYYTTTPETIRKLGELRPRYYDPRRPPAASLAPISGTSHGGTLTVDMIAVPTPRSRVNSYGRANFGHGLAEKEALAGWLSLFDGQSTFGWEGASAHGGLLRSGKTTIILPPCEVKAEVARFGTIILGGKKHEVGLGTFTLQDTGQAGPIQLLGTAVRTLHVRPLGLQPLFHGKDLSGWKRIDHPKLAEERRPRWAVQEGTIVATGGPGALEYQERLFGDLCLQVEVRTRLRHANGGIFFRSIPGDFMNGYEAQVYNRCRDGNVFQPWTWATGAIDDRQNARQLASRDGQPFLMTVLARGPHLATWVNGVQTVDWTDTRKLHANPRQGLRLEAGSLQLQAHDAGTEIEFRRIAARD